MDAADISLGDFIKDARDRFLLQALVDHTKLLQQKLQERNGNGFLPTAQNIVRRGGGEEVEDGGAVILALYTAKFLEEPLPRDSVCATALGQTVGALKGAKSLGGGRIEDAVYGDARNAGTRGRGDAVFPPFLKKRWSQKTL